MPRPFPPVEAIPLENQRGQSFPRLVELMQRLLAPDGCPWDREQTPESLRRYVLEEACEVIDAIESGKVEAIREELGDLALQVVFLAEIFRDRGEFGPDDVIKGIVDKLVHRHPHVFSDTEVGNADEVVRNWERLKAREKKNRGLLEGVPRSLPALTRAQRIGEKVARVGFDWPDARGPRAKVDEEIGELDRAIESGDRDRMEEELGDLLFSLVNLSRHLDLDAEGALRRTMAKFEKRFAHVEKKVREEHGGFPKPGEKALPLDELDRYWDEAKD